MNSLEENEAMNRIKARLVKAERDAKEQRLGREKAERAIEEERIGRETAERAVEEERIGRETAERAVKDERIGRKNEKRRRKEERIGRKNERRRRKEDRRRQKKADRKYRSTTIPELLGFYHTLSMNAKVETNPEVLAAGVTTKPAGRKYPKRIVPWDNFANRQKEIWKIICESSIYSERLFDPSDTIQPKKLAPVRSDGDLVANEGVSVLEPVQAILQEFFKNEELRKQLRIPGSVSFVPHLRLDTGKQNASKMDVSLLFNPFTLSNAPTKPKS